MSTTETKPELINRTIFLNETHVVPNTGNSRMVYNFNSPLQLRPGDKIALAQISVFKSWFNISQKYNNNQFSYRWFNSAGVLNQTITLTIPDGCYSVSDLQLWLESQMFQRGHFLRNTATGLNVYYITFFPNAIQYAIQIYCNAVPSNLTGFTKSGTWGLPTVSTCPQVIVSGLNEFKRLIGFSEGVYPPTLITGTNYTVISNNGPPRMSPVSSILLKCNLISNDIINPSNILHIFTDAGKSFGDLIDESPNNLLYINTHVGWYNSVVLEFVDQNFNPIDFIEAPTVVFLSVLSQN